MTTFLADWLQALWMVLAESGPFLLVGFVIAGFLAIFLPTRWISRRLGGDDVKSVATAAIIGIPVPLCSCSVIPTATQLRRSGASRGATTAFLISTPETGVDSIGATWALMDPLMTIVRPVAAFITAFSAGVAVNLFGRGEAGPLEKESLEEGSPAAESPETDAAAGSSCCGDTVPAPEPKSGCTEPEPGPESCCAEPEAGGTGDDHAHDHAHDHDHAPAAGASVPRRALRYAFGTLLDDLTPWFLIGFALSAVIVVAVPDGFFTGTILTGWAAMFVMLIAGVPLYVCATASTPIAAAMMAKGLEPGAALVFLLAGPATNIATILVVRNLLGKRALIAYLTSIAVVSLVLGNVVNFLYPLLGFDPTDMDVTPGTMEHGVIATVSGVVLALLLARSAWRLRLDRSLGTWLRRAGGPLGLDLTALPVKLCVLAALALAYASTALTVVSPGETVFIERFGRIAHEHSTPGPILHAPWPLDATVRVATAEIRSLEFGVDRSPIDDATIGVIALREEKLRIARLDAEAETLTGDGLLLSIRFSVQYHVTDARAWHYGQSDPEGLIARLAQDALRRSIATRDADSVLIGTTRQFTADIESRLAADLARTGVGATLVTVTMHGVHALPAVHDDYRKVASAMEDARTEVRKSEIARMEMLSEARTDALRLVRRAKMGSLEAEALARGLASAFLALTVVHDEAPRFVDAAMWLDALRRAFRADPDNARPIVLILGENITPILLPRSSGEPPPDALDGLLPSRR